VIARRFWVLVVIAACLAARPLYAQFTDPRTYTVAPVVLNQIELDYAYAHTSASLDPSLEVVGAHVVLNTGVLSYTHNFSALGHLSWIKATLPYASVSGSVAGTDLARSENGAGDASFELAALLTGGKALSPEQFATYESAMTVGMSLTVSAPTGEYEPDRLLNLGSHRWSFKPEFAVSIPFGPEQKWVVDGYINAYFFTDNTEYHGVEVLRQEALPGIEGHLSYSPTSSFWASLDLRYSFRGDTVVDGLDQNNTQQNLTVGSEASWSANDHNSLMLVFAKAVVHQNAPAYTGIALKYVYSWGTGIK
jgi:hypothetical protein